MRRWTRVALLALCACTSASVAEAGLFSTVYRMDNYVGGLKSTSSAGEVTAFANPGWYYEVLSSAGGKTRVRFVRRAKTTKQPAGAASTPSAGSNGEVQVGGIYVVDDSMLNLAGNKTLVQTFESGVLAVPFKFRPDVPGSVSQLTGSGSLGAAFAWRAKTDFSTTELSPLLFVGLSQVALEQNEGAAAKETQALTLATGLQIEVIGRTKLGVVVGWDRAFGAEGRAWAYQGRPWFSVGINYAFLTAEKTEAE